MMDKKLTQEELFHQLDEMTGRRYMDFPWSIKDRQAYDQIKEIIKTWRDKTTEKTYGE